MLHNQEALLPSGLQKSDIRQAQEIVIRTMQIYNQLYSNCYKTTRANKYLEKNR